MSENNKLFSFDDVAVDCENFQVRKAGVAVTLTPRAFDVLRVLLRQPGRVVDKGELFAQVWGETHVTDNALTKIIKELRHSLHDDAHAPRYIETVPKRGYRFIGEVTEQSHEPSGVMTATSPRSRAGFWGLSIAVLMGIFLLAWFTFRQKNTVPATQQIRSLAVLPLKAVNVDGRDESLEMGMAETLITRLSNLRQVVVRPMSAVRKYSDPQQDAIKAGREVQADAVLDGSIQKVDGRVRVTMRLIDVRDGRVVWSENFDENFTDIFKVQDSITERITTALTLQLSRQEKEQLAKHYTDNPEAYHSYLRGQLTWHSRRQNWIEQSLEHYQQALQKDPNFALAHIGVADCYIMMSGHRRISMPEAEKQARPSILMALKIDNNLAQAHNALAELKYQYEYDWTGAQSEFKKAIELNPNVAWIRQAHGWFLMSLGRFDEATAEMEMARQLDPSSLTINVGRGRLFYYTRQYDQAMKQFQNIIAVEPNDASAHFALYSIYQQKRMYGEAVESYLKFLSMIPNAVPTELIGQLREAFKASGWNGFLRKQLEVLEAKAKNGEVPPFALANLYVRLGEKDKAFAWFEKTFAARDPLVLQFKIEPAYDVLRNDPRYVQLIRKIGLDA